MLAAIGVAGSGAMGTITTFSYTVPAGGFDLQAPLSFPDPSTVMTSFSSVPYAKVVEFTWTDLSLTTITDTWGSDIAVGFGGRASHSETVISAGPFFDQNTTGTFGPSTQVFDLTGDAFYVSSTGTLPLVAYSGYDNGGPSQGTLAAGSHITISVDDSILEPPVTEPTATNLGTLAPGTTFTAGGTIGAGEVGWFKFTLTGPVAAGELLPFLDITTNGTPFDTEMGLYDSTGALVALDDDSGFGLNSLLTFGTGSGLELGDFLGDPVFGDGFNGDLPAGAYYLAIGGYNTEFDAGFGAVADGDSENGDYTVTFIGAVVPEPVGLLPVAGVGMLLGRRRR